MKSIMISHVRENIHYTVASGYVQDAKENRFIIEGFSIGWRLPDMKEAKLLSQRGDENFFYERSKDDVVVFGSYDLTGDLILVRDFVNNEEINYEHSLASRSRQQSLKAELLT